MYYSIVLYCFTGNAKVEVRLSLVLVLCVLFPFPDGDAGDDGDDDVVHIECINWKLHIVWFYNTLTHSIHTPAIIILCKHVAFNYFIRFIFVAHSKTSCTVVVASECILLMKKLFYPMNVTKNSFFSLSGHIFLFAQMLLT